MAKFSAPQFIKTTFRLLITAVAIIAGAPVFSGAPLYAQTDPGTDLTSLIRTITQQADSTSQSKALIHQPDNTSPFEPNVAQLPPLDDAAVAGNILERLILEASRNPKDEKPTTSASVLDFMTKVYADHSFYQSGHWDDAEDWSAITRNIRLPEYDPADFYRPVWGRVTSGYGFRPSFGRLHKGIDLALNVGDTVRAALPGVVGKVSYDPGGYGHYVVVVHNNGMETRYAHLLAPLSTLGQTVMAGQPLGLGGNSGNSTGPHLHFEVRYRGTALDPASLFNFTTIHFLKDP